MAGDTVPDLLGRDCDGGDLPWRFPGVRSDNDQVLVRLAERWLEAKHVSLWADWDLSRPERRRIAAEWFAAEYRSFRAFLPGMAEPKHDKHGSKLAHRLARRMFKRQR